MIPRMGSHLMLDFVGISSINLDDLTEVDKVLRQCIIDCEATICSSQIKKFEPQGLSILYLLSESHFSIHTWPEFRSCAIDFYHCGDTANRRLKKAEEILCTFFGWENCSGSILIDRGGQRQTMLNSYNHSTTIFKGLKLVHRERTDYQDMRVYESKEMGKILCLDGMVQISDKLDDNYSADLSSLIVQKGERYENLLVIGAADLKVPSYILNNADYDIGKITVVEIDEKVFNGTNNFFKSLESVQKHISSGMLEIVFADGAKFLKSKKTEGFAYDGIIIDNSDVSISEGPAATLFTEEFYSNIFSCLKKGASFSQQVSDEKVKIQWECMVKSVGFRELKMVYSKAEFSVSLPIGSGKKS